MTERRAFTLIEMLIVVVVLAALMGIVVKLIADSEGQAAKLTTITRLHRLENCLSGYYAAYGGYPPVALHGSRDIYLEVGSDGVQLPGGTRNENMWDDEETAWKQVDAACLSQPVSCDFPFKNDPDKQTQIDMLSETYKALVEAADEDAIVYMKEKYLAGFNGLGNESPSVGQLNVHKDTASDWREMKLFRFGLMSYLLPRYLLMASANNEFYSYKQWLDNNENPCDPFTGLRMTWDTVNALAMDPTGANKLGSISSQKVCSRWMPNLEGTCESYEMQRIIFGVDIVARGRFNTNAKLSYQMRYNPNSGEYEKWAIVNPPVKMWVPDGGNPNRDQYILDYVSVEDGWKRDFYYYSPAPHQRYQLWSAGPNGRTFPPWIAKENLPEKANGIVHMWTIDDIIQMSH